MRILCFFLAFGLALIHPPATNASGLNYTAIKRHKSVPAQGTSPQQTMQDDNTSRSEAMSEAMNNVWKKYKTLSQTQKPNETTQHQAIQDQDTQTQTGQSTASGIGSAQDANIESDLPAATTGLGMIIRQVNKRQTQGTPMKSMTIHKP